MAEFLSAIVILKQTTRINMFKQRYNGLAMWRCFRSCASLEWKRHVTEKFTEYCYIHMRYTLFWDMMLHPCVTDFQHFKTLQVSYLQESKMSNNNQEPIDQQCIITSQKNGYLIHTTVKTW